MSAYTGGSVPLYSGGSDFVGGTVFGGWVSDEEYAERAEREKQRLAEADKNFPVEGWSGEFDQRYGKPSMDVWKTGEDSDESLSFEMAQCDFCSNERATLSINNDYVDVNVCQECLGKMFDVFGGAE